MQFRIISILFFCLAVISATAQQNLAKAFAHPGKQYGSAPLWVWHTKITRPIIDSMMKEFKQNAFGGVMVHPRPGLVTEYLSNEWYDLFSYTVQKGKQLGLDVWIYDENSYPSGFAGGLLPHQMPESYNQGQMLRLTKATGCPADTSGIFICLKEENGSFTDITPAINTEKGKTGNYYCFSKAYYQKQAGMVGPPDYPYVDLMVKGVTEKFIDISCKGYEKIVGAEFGKTVPGIFSDEPSIPAHGAGQIRWTPDLFTTFQQLWGYDLKTQLPSLFEETGDWKKVRHNFQRTLLHLFIERWSKPMYNYTQQHHLKWTGHYWEHGWPDPGEGPDNMAMYAWHQQPGIDMLFNQFNETSANAQFGNIRSVKELASVANQLNKSRTLSETYGGGGWELTFKDMKRLADWEYVLGVNFLNQHLSMMTLTGVRKYDYPQSFSYHAPWWPYYKTLNQYYARLSFALSQGQQLNNILIVEPTSSAWMYSLNGKPNKRMHEIGSLFQAFVTRLEKMQVEYDLGSENIIKDHGKAANGKFIVGSRHYTTVVIPPGMENIDAPTYKLLKAFVEQGGKLLQFEELQRVDGAVSNELEKFNQPLLELDPDVINQHFQSTGLTIKKEGGNLYHHRRQLSDGQLLFLSNASMETATNATVQIKGKDVLLLDLFTGEIFDYTEKGKDDFVNFHCNIPPAGSLLLFVANGKQSGYKKYLAPENTTTITTTPLKVIRPAYNTLMIDFCDVQLKDTLLKDCHTFTASRITFQKHGFTKDPWDHQMQFKDRIIARDTFSKGTGFTATYHFTIDAQINYQQFKAVVEQGNLWKKITINGTPVQPQKNQWWLDRSFAVLEIGQYLQAGENTLSISIDPMSVYAEIEPVYILGNFNITPATKGWTLTAPQPLQVGSWKQQGFPLYAQGITYVKECNLTDTKGGYAIQLGDWKGTVATVKVNGVQAGIIIAEPNMLEISRYLKKGNNRIEVTVIGSLKNLLGPHHNNPKPGLVGPGHWSNVKTHPSGSEYQLYDYGLMQDFQVVKY
jgi:hypothetical protein